MVIRIPFCASQNSVYSCTRQLLHPRENRHQESPHQNPHPVKHAGLLATLGMIVSGLLFPLANAILACDGPKKVPVDQVAILRSTEANGSSQLQQGEEKIPDSFRKARQVRLYRLQPHFVIETSIEGKTLDGQTGQLEIQYAYRLSPEAIKSLDAELIGKPVDSKNFNEKDTQHPETAEVNDVLLQMHIVRPLVERAVKQFIRGKLSSQLEMGGSRQQQAIEVELFRGYTDATGIPHPGLVTQALAEKGITLTRQTVIQSKP